MENQPIEMEISKPLAMSAMKRDNLEKEVEKPIEEVPVVVGGQTGIAKEKEIK